MVTKDTPLNELFDAACLYADTIVQSGENFRVKRPVPWRRVESHSKRVSHEARVSVLCLCDR